MKFCNEALNVLEIESRAIAQLSTHIDEHFEKACEMLLACRGRVIVMGVGKSGHIASKIAATFASTGTPAFFVHPGDASHGDLGMITSKDIVLAISYSGESDELVVLIPTLKRLNVPLIAITGKSNSSLAKRANVVLSVAVEREACPHNLAPTTSTTATLVMGDALAVALLKVRGFTAEDFARSHPGGRLGRRLLLTVDDLMKQGDALPQVAANTLLNQALIVITEKKLGMTTVVDDQQHLLGIFTDGDLRRVINKNIDIHRTPICAVMTKKPHIISPGFLAFDAFNLMETHKITSLVIVNEQHQPIGVVHLHDILNAGLI